MRFLTDACWNPSARELWFNGLVVVCSAAEVLVKKDSKQFEIGYMRWSDVASDADDPASVFLCVSPRPRYGPQPDLFANFNVTISASSMSPHDTMEQGQTTR